VKRLIASGKLFLDGAPAREEARRVAPGQAVELRMSAPRPRAEAPGPPPSALEVVYEDPHLVVIDKPVGISSVPYEEGEERSAMDLVYARWRAEGRKAAHGLQKVHRIDKVTSGLLVYARSEHARAALDRLFRRHDIERAYLCVAEGRVEPGTIDRPLVKDRGDGLRWVARPGQTPQKEAITHVQVLERLRGATLCRITLETGRTHQIRIHFAAAGHPLLGEHVYARDWVNRGAPLLPAPRLMLHATALGFPHPVSGAPLRFERPPPPEFEAVVAGLRGG
jgi:23S rRNA pseudouridine1911/1915/1917 synthase